MPKHPATNEFGWLLRDVRLAFRRKDCYGAREVVRKMLPRAKTSAQQETVFRLQNAIRRCDARQYKDDDLGQTGRCARRPSERIDVHKIPVGTPIIDCGDVYVAQLDGGDAVVDVTTGHRIEARSRLRRAATRGTFAGAKRRRRRK